MEDLFFEDLITRVFQKELMIINKHLPYKRIDLCKLESMNIPHYVSRDGSINLIDPRELKYLHEMAGEDACKLHIPIVIEYSSSLGEGTYIVRDPIASRVLAKILGVEYRGGTLIIYRPQLYEIRSRLKTTTTIVFTP